MPHTISSKGPMEWAYMPSIFVNDVYMPNKTGQSSFGSSQADQVTTVDTVTVGIASLSSTDVKA